MVTISYIGGQVSFRNLISSIKFAQKNRYKTGERFISVPTSGQVRLHLYSVHMKLGKNFCFKGALDSNKLTAENTETALLALS